MNADEPLLKYIGSLDNSLRELNLSYKELNNKVDAHINSDNIRLGALETSGAVSAGILKAERRKTDKRDRFVNTAITILISSVVALTAAYIDRQPTGENNANPALVSDTANRPPRPSDGR